MKLQLKHIIIILFFANKSLAQMGINASGTAPATSAMLDVSSTSKGLLPPRMNTSQRTGIGSPAKGLIVFDTDLNSPFYFNGSSWINHSGVGAFTLPLDITQDYAGTLFYLSNTNPSSTSYVIKAVNTGAGAAIYGENRGSGIGGYFSNYIGSTSPALFASTFGTAPAIEARAGVTGSGGRFEVGVESNNNSALFATTYGGGTAFVATTQGSGATGAAIRGTNNSTNTATIIAENNFANGLALQLQGGIKVSGTADQKTAFKIVSNPANININQLRIPNTTVANNINDILIITHNYGSGATNNFTKACGVYWDPGFSEWRIYVEEGSAMPVGITFNVLVIKQ